MISSPIFTTSKQSSEIVPEDAKTYIRLHKEKELDRLERLNDYYNGDHDILNRKKDSNLKNNRSVTNHASYIADFTSGYLVGEPVTYSAADIDITPITDILDDMDASTQDSDLALDDSIFGRAYDMIYMNSEAKPKLARLSPLGAFVVYDNTVEQKPVFAVYYYPVYDSATGTIKQYNGKMCTDRLMYDIILDSTLNSLKVAEDGIHEHPFGAVPINEIYNNGRRSGDFEDVISLIDDYNLLQSDRVNDKEQFVDAMLVIKGTTLGDDDEEKLTTYNDLKKQKVLELPAEGADAQFLTRQLDESSVEILRKSIVSDIHKISGVPDMSDEQFAGNSSGVAMKYKLLGLEQKTKTKQRYFTEGLRIRLQSIANVIVAKGGAAIDVSKITIKFKRSLPENEVENAQKVSMLNGIVPQSVLFDMIPAITDVESAKAELQEEKAAAVKAQQEAFANTPLKTDEE